MKPVAAVIALLVLAACEAPGSATNQTSAFEEAFRDAGS